MMRRLRYFWEKVTSRNWQWGHPEEWTDAEWFYWRREQDKNSRKRG